MTTTMYLDAPSLVYRAFFALPTSMKDARGTSINAVRGFMEMVTRLLVDRRPDAIVATFDDDYRPKFRVDIYPAYKADRPEDPDELPPQFAILTRILDAAGIPRASSPGLEADDTLAALTKDLTGDEVGVVVSGDRDLTCLVRDPNVRLLFPVKGVSEMTDYDEAAVFARYSVTPRQYCDFAIMRGDPSDGLPGIAGVGPKRAAELLARYGTLEGIVEHANELTPKVRASFEAAIEYLGAMKVVVEPVWDAPVEMTESHEPDEHALKELAEKHNLGSSATRLAQVLAGKR